tara:strand:- start:1792 stop:2181 length:390 start_codon:yes stop_codon:yes gene_type:complete
MPEDRPKGYGIYFFVSDKFIEFAKKQEIDKKRYEKIGLNFIPSSGWPNIKYSSFRGGICSWVKNTGLLRHINVPGNVAGVALEESIFESPDYHNIYYPHNIDSILQTSAILAIMSHYLNDIESRISSSK